LVIFRSGPDEFDTCLSKLATQIGFRIARRWSPRKKISYVVYRTLLAQLEGELSTLCRSAMSFFWRGAGRLLSLGNADTGQGDPGWRITRRKSIDQALSDFVGDRDRFNICRLNISKRPGICPAFSASTVQCPGRHRMPA
jgi:hypothetical protein